MKNLIVFIFVLFLSLTGNCQVHVNGYTKSNGTYVAPYVRSNPNSTRTDNYSYPGNTNPYTGKAATGNSEAYSNKNNRGSSPSEIWIKGYYKNDGTYVNGHWRTIRNNNPYNQNNPSYSYHPYGINNGKLSLWTDCSDDGPISVYIDDTYQGEIASYFNANSPPNCGDNGTLNLLLPEGIYKIVAYGNNKKWEGNITIISDVCNSKQFSK